VFKDGQFTLFLEHSNHKAGAVDVPPVAFTGVSYANRVHDRVHGPVGHLCRPLVLEQVQRGEGKVFEVGA
jgi:hypothetical protein